MTAIWIINEACIVPALVSVASFSEANRIELRILFCGELTPEIIAAFHQINPTIELVQYQSDTTAYAPVNSGLLTNRMARFDAVMGQEDEIVILIDADTAFTPAIADALEEIEATCRLSMHTPMTWGVNEYEHASDAWLYFNQTALPNGLQTVPPVIQQQEQRKIFGDQYAELLSSPQYNNGLLFFYKCQDIARLWKDYYCAGLASPYVNPADDQVPLSVAIAASTCKRFDLPQSYNSLGNHNGDFACYHVWDNRWVNEFFSVERQFKSLSNYALIAKRYWPLIPQSLKDRLWVHYDLKPHFYRNFKKEQDLTGICESTLENVEQGNVVQLGIGSGRTACYLAEWIHYSCRELQLTAIDEYTNNSYPIEVLEEAFEAIQLLDQVEFIDSNLLEAASAFEDQSIAVLICNETANTIQQLLSVWLPKLKPDARIAGIDFTIQLGWTTSAQSDSEQFAQANGYNFTRRQNLFQLTKKEQLIPLTFHFIWLKPLTGNAKPFSYHHYLCLQSVIHHHPNAEFNLYTNAPLEGNWAMQIPTCVNIIQCDAPEQIYVQPIRKVQHQSDILRLSTLIDSGGIYLDLDIFCIRPLYNLLHFPLVMGAEKHGGLCNAVLLAEPQSPFLIHWLEGYHPAQQTAQFKFDPDGWGEMSLDYPKHLSYEYQQYIHLMPPTAFFDPIGTPRELKMLFEADSLHKADRYVHHLWESQSWEIYLKELTPEKIATEQGYFYQLVRDTLSPEIINGSISKTLAYVSV